MNAKGLIVSVVCLGAIAVIAERNFAATPDNHLQARTTPLPANSGISGPVKMCSVMLDGRWRDTVSVPDSWKPQDCAAFATHVGADTVELICADTGGIVSGNPYGAGGAANIPQNDKCKWGSGH